MASVYGLGKTNQDPRSGGKIVTKRHIRLKTTPYDRPASSLQLPPKNRNWISDVIFPATRVIASCAAMLWSSVFDDSDDNSSLSSSDNIPASENDIEDDNYYDSSDDINCLVEDHVATSEATPQPSPQTSDANHVEQLLLKGEFSRQDCNRFMKLIESRVSGSNFKGGEDGISTETLSENIGSYMDDVCSKAVLEARKWLHAKKVGYSPLSHMADASDGLNSFSRKHLHNEVGSPADVAKVYMKCRPPWASLSGEHCETRSPFTITSPIFRRELFSADEGTLSSIKKRSSLASGSWNIQEEIRKVRSKATEDLLHSSFSAKVDMSSVALTVEHGQDSSVTKLSIPIVGENEGNMLNSSENFKQLDQQSKLATTRGNCEISDLEVIEKMAENKVLEKVAIPATTLVSKKYSGLHSIKTAGESTTSMPDPASKDLSNQHVNDPSRIHLKGSPVDKNSKCDATQNDNISTSVATLSADVRIEENQSKLIEKNITQNDNFSTSVATLSADVRIEENQSKLIEKNMNDEKAADFIHKHEFKTETSVEVPVMRETNSFDKLSHRPADMGDEVLSGELSRPYAAKVTKEAQGVAVKLEGKKTGKYSRRNKGRGKMIYG